MSRSRRRAGRISRSTVVLALSAIMLAACGAAEDDAAGPTEDQTEDAAAEADTDDATGEDAADDEPSAQPTDDTDNSTEETGDSIPALLAEMREAGCATAALSQAPPYSDITADGTPDGYLPSLTAVVFAALGVDELCPELTTFDAMIPGLQAGRFDVLPGGLNITEERCEQILFSQPVTLQYEALGVPAGNPASLSDYASIAADTSLTLAVFSGSSQEAFALAQGVSADQLLTVPDSQSGVEAVEVGRADAFGAGQFTLELSFADSPIEVLVDRASNPSMIGIGFRQDAAEVRDLFDEQLEVLRTSGELGELYASFGFPNPDDLAGISRSDVAATCS